MTSATQSLLAGYFTARETDATTGGDHRPRPGPLFIQDAVTPWRGETLLLALLRADIERADKSGT
jgi:hypothetical protein